MTKPKRMGRPPIDRKLRRETAIHARVTNRERAAVIAAAHAASMSESDFVRYAVFSLVPELSGEKR